jgi:16S rRNA (uracil1498-N3)-methyltransferase
MSNRIYIKESLSPSTNIPISDENIHYLINVLRLADGSEIRIFNECDGEYRARVNRLSKKEYELKICSKIRDLTKSPKIILALALIKNDKFLLALEKITELGVTEIQPIICERSQYSKLNMERSFKCLKEATEQSERFEIPSLKEPITLKDLINQYEDIIICSERAEKWQNLLKVNYSQDTCFVIGPEGGFSQKEFDLLIHLKHISLGNNILRAETAAIALVSQLELLRTPVL